MKLATQIADGKFGGGAGNFAQRRRCKERDNRFHRVGCKPSDLHHQTCQPVVVGIVTFGGLHFQFLDLRLGLLTVFRRRGPDRGFQRREVLGQISRRLVDLSHLPAGLVEAGDVHFVPAHKVAALDIHIAFDDRATAGLVAIADLAHIAADDMAVNCAGDVLLVAVDRLPLLGDLRVERARLRLNLHFIRFQVGRHAFGLHLPARIEGDDVIVGFAVIIDRMLFSACPPGHCLPGVPEQVRHPHLPVLLRCAIAAERFQQGQRKRAARLARVG